MTKYLSQLRVWCSSKAVRTDGFILLGLIALCVGINLPAYVHIITDAARLNTLSLDEWVYSNFLNEEFYRQLLSPNFYKLVVLKDWWGYGSLFWYSYGLAALPAKLTGSFPAMIISLRIFSAIWEGIALFFIYKTILVIRGKYINAILGAVVILAMPGFYFYFKAFSAEFMTCAIAMASVYYLIKDNFRCQRSFFIATLLLGIAVGVKLSVVTFVPWYALYVCVVCWRSKKLFSKFVRYTIQTILIFCLGFLIANPYLAVLGRTGINHYYALAQQNVRDNALNHGASIEGLDYHAWYTQIIQPDYLPSLFTGLALLAYIIAIVYSRKEQRWQIALVGALASSYLGYIVWTVHKLWSWYLFPGMFLILLGCFVLPVDRIRLFKRYPWLEWCLLIILVLSLFGWNANSIAAKYRINAQRETDPAFQVKIAAKEQFDQWLQDQNLNHILIVKSAFIYFDETQFDEISVIPIFGTLNSDYLPAYAPKLFLIEKNYGFMKPDSEIQSWTSYASLLAEREFFQQLTTTGVTVGNQTYLYNQVFETDDFFVYERTQ